jgi:hypothetical protein
VLELLLLLGVAIYLVSQVKQGEETPLARASPRTVAPQAAPAAALGALQRLTIADTQRPCLASAAFVRAFGLDPLAIRDLRMYVRSGPLESFPEEVAALVRALHDEGSVVGAETMALLFHGRALGPGEALYFALAAGEPMPRVVAFIGKRL